MTNYAALPETLCTFLVSREYTPVFIHSNPPNNPPPYTRSKALKAHMNPIHAGTPVRSVSGLSTPFSGLLPHPLMVNANSLLFVSDIRHIGCGGVLLVGKSELNLIGVGGQGGG
jgi:hypothetical protein